MNWMGAFGANLESKMNNMGSKLNESSASTGQKDILNPYFNPTLQPNFQTPHLYNQQLTPEQLAVAATNIMNKNKSINFASQLPSCQYTDPNSSNQTQSMKQPITSSSVLMSPTNVPTIAPPSLYEIVLNTPMSSNTITTDITTNATGNITQLPFSLPSVLPSVLPSSQFIEMYHTTTGEILDVYKSIKEAADFLRISEDGVLACCNGVIPSFHGFKWKYHEGLENDCE